MIEILSDTGLGKEMHSVVSQGRVAEIVTSKPRDRRLLIEEAAGLGKHRKRRRRAQIKLERTQDNLDRALDVEREARTRLKPLKRQAEAAELHERIERQSDEARWTLVRDSARGARAALAACEAAVGVARAAAAETEAELEAVGTRREQAELALSARGAERESLSARFYAARSAAERIGLRLDSAQRMAAELASRTERRRSAIAAWESEAAADVGDDGAAERIAALEAELAQLAEDRRARLERELAELEARREAAAAVVAEREQAASAALAARGEVDAAAEAARTARRELDTAAERARRESARIGAELAKVNQFLRSHAGAPGGAQALADTLTAAPGYELALAAALGPRLRAAVAGDLAEGAALLDRAGKDGGAALILPRDAGPATASGAAATAPAGAEPLSAHVRASGDAAARRLAAAILADVWVVEQIEGLGDFSAIAVTKDGRVWSPATRELRQVPPGGEDRVLASATGARTWCARSRPPHGPSAPRWPRSTTRSGRWPRPTRGATPPSARRAKPPAPATRPRNPSATWAGWSSSVATRPTRARARSAGSRSRARSRPSASWSSAPSASGASASDGSGRSTPAWSATSGWCRSRSASPRRWSRPAPRSPPRSRRWRPS